MADKYVRDMNGAELRAHMCRLQAIPGWHEPLADSLYAEIKRLDSLLAASPAELTDERIEAIWDSTPTAETGEEMRRRFARALLAASPADQVQVEDARGKTWALFELRRLPAVTINEIDGEESDGTPKTWRRPYVSRRKVEELLDAIYDQVAMSATPPEAEFTESRT